MRDSALKMSIWHTFVYHALIAGVPTVIIVLTAVICSLLMDYFKNPIFILLVLPGLAIFIAFSCRADDVFIYFFPAYRKNLP